MSGISDDNIWKMLDAWYPLIGRRIAPTDAERRSDFDAMKRHLEAFEAEMEAKKKP